MIAKSQHGQSMVEFAIILPFLLAVCGIMIVLCLMFADYVQVQYEARSITRACTVLDGYTDSDKQKVVDAYNRDAVKPRLFLYQWSFDKSDISYSYDENSDDNGYWTVSLEAKPQDTSKGLWSLAVDVAKDNMPPITASCTMYSENNLHKTNSNGT